MEDNTYIICDKQTNKVTETFKFFGQMSEAVEKGKGKLDWLNRTNPKHRNQFEKLIFPV
mgnify:CR=1 FL=1